MNIEGMSIAITIMEIGNNEFRLDLPDYIKNDNGINKTSRGLTSLFSVMEIVVFASLWLR